MAKLTDNEIIKAWEKVLATGDAPVGEHWSVGGIVTTQLAKETFDMLNRQKAEKEALVNGQETLQKYIAEYKAEVERLKIANVEAYSSGFGVGKIAGRKEFAKRFENNIKDVRVTLGQTWEIQNALKKTLKELTDFKENGQ